MIADELKKCSVCKCATCNSDNCERGCAFVGICGEHNYPKIFCDDYVEKEGLHDYLRRTERGI